LDYEPRRSQTRLGREHCAINLGRPFDLIELDGDDLRRSSIEYRKRKLAKLARKPEPGIVLHRTGIAQVRVVPVRLSKILVATD
jgi:ATP-dependent DNA ligase